MLTFSVLLVLLTPSEANDCQAHFYVVFPPRKQPIYQNEGQIFSILPFFVGGGYVEHESSFIFILGIFILGLPTEYMCNCFPALPESPRSGLPHPLLFSHRSHRGPWHEACSVGQRARMGKEPPARAPKGEEVRCCCWSLGCTIRVF